NRVLDWQFDAALDGNIALTAEIDLTKGTDFVLGLAFGDTAHRAIANLAQSLVTPFDDSLQRFREEWDRAASHLTPPAGDADRRLSRGDADRRVSRGDTDRRASRLYQRSVNLLLAHEDKSYPGAMIAALSIPWGSSKGDEELGGYHLVWTRDLVQSATALLAAGDTATPLRALVYLAVSQRPDGGFFQNSWIDGRAYWGGMQLDEVAFPLVLAWRLHQENALAGFDPSAMIAAACGFLMREGPATAQDRWEEAGGFSPSTLAINIAGLICAAELMAARGDHHTADFVRDYADVLDAHVEAWTVTTQGTVHPHIARHYIRVNPNTVGLDDPNMGMLTLANQPPGGPHQYPAKDIVDAGFLELVRYGVRAAADPIVVDSLTVVDDILKVQLPAGPFWRRYNHDGYGQRHDGSSYRAWGVGRPWPLLTGERGHYELAAGRDARPYLRALERCAVGVGLIPEQVWDQEPNPDKLLVPGGPTGAAIPLAWAQAEYIKLVRSIIDKRVFDMIEPVRARYADRKPVDRAAIEIWSLKRPVASISRGARLRVIAAASFALYWSPDDWQTQQRSAGLPTPLEVWFTDIPRQLDGATRLQLSFVANDGQVRDATVEIK
ncbi:MAG: glycoside hydrolase family 15 protein, partial [Acidobacteriota bacterium]